MIQIGNKEVASITIGGKEVQTITIGGKVAYEKQQDNTDYFYIQNTYAGQNIVTLTTTTTGSPSSSDYSTTVQYSKDRTNWTTVTFDTSTPTTISMNQGEKVYFRNNNGKFNYTDFTNSYYTCFSCGESHIAGGNAMSLLDYTNINNVTLSTGCFSYLFYNDTTLTDSSNLELPAITLADNCYAYLFQGCSLLTAGPVLPATTLANSCYRSMFLYCSSLTSTPSLPATIMYDRCYQSMFNRCTSLTNTPSLPATQLNSYCYSGMFFGCTSLTSAPALPATTLVGGCYQTMFRDCTSLTSAPSLPATTLPDYCYYYMFSGCTSLNSVTTYANSIPYSNCLDMWLENVAASGTFYNFGTATYSSGISGIPSGWTEHKIKMTEVVLTPATGTEYSVTANLEWSSNLTWTSADIDISNTDQGAGNRNTYLTFTPSEVSNGVLTATNNIDIYFQDPDNWFTLTVYNGNTVVDTQYITYTIR